MVSTSCTHYSKTLKRKGEVAWQSQVPASPFHFRTLFPARTSSCHLLALKPVTRGSSSERKSWRCLHRRQRMAHTDIPFQLTHHGVTSSAEADCHQTKPERGRFTKYSTVLVKSRGCPHTLEKKGSFGQVNATLLVKTLTLVSLSYIKDQVS